MRVLVVNAGSSSLKLSVLSPTDDVEASETIDGWDGTIDHDELTAFHEAHPDVDAVGHRVVHGGPDLVGPTVVDDDVVARILALDDLAPLHQRRAVAGIEATTAAYTAPQVACFDTGFHATLPAEASTYAIPRDWRERLGVRRYGFHGLSHAYAVRRALAITGAPADARVVSCHLGSGASLCAARNGHSVDTTMGFTPLEGLVMATRSGSVDPGAVLWLIEHAGLDPAAVRDGLEHRGGVAGLVDGSGDLRDVVAAAAARDPDAELALAVHAHRLAQGIAAMASSLDGLDVLVFTGGVGEHQPAVRAAAAARLGFLGVALDDHRNATTTEDGAITATGAAVDTVVLTAREDLEIARQVRDALGAPGGA